MASIAFVERYYVYTNDACADPLGKIIKEGEWVFKPYIESNISLAELNKISEKIKKLNTRKKC